MPTGKSISIKYTSRTYDSIKTDLVQHVKKYYPNTHKDFNEGSFGSMILDTVAYVGDVLSFYLDYNFNESFLQNALELKNVLKLSRQHGYKHTPLSNSFGTVDIYILLLAEPGAAAPREDYLPIIRKGSVFSTPGSRTFTLAEDIDFASALVKYTVGDIDAAGNPINFVLKTSGIVISGKIKTTIIELGDFQKFRKVYLPEINITEIISVFDLEGNEYFQVDYLSQDVIYKNIPNTNADSKLFASAIIKPMAAPRRFVLEREADNRPYLLFGTVSNNDVLNKSFVDPNEMVMDLHGKDYFVDKAFDPNNMFENDKFGVAPANTSLLITYRHTSPGNINLASNSLTVPVNVIIDFADEKTVPSEVVNSIRNSVECDNSSPIRGDVDSVTVDEARILALDNFATQNRAVSKADYVNLAYRMPSQFGAIKRTNIFQDHDEFKRNLNMLVISEDEVGNLAQTTSIVKTNLKVWLNSNKMINDTIDILDAYIINLGVNFTIVSQPYVNKFDAIAAALEKLRSELLSPKMHIGQSFYITEIYNHLKNVDEVLDVTKVQLVNKISSNHSNLFYNIENNMSADARILHCKENMIFEFKYEDDIKGAVI